MKRIAVVFSVVALVASAAAVIAQEDPIEARQAFMKENGRLLGAMGPMTKGEQPFDAAAAMEMLEAFNAHVQTLDVAVLFPEGSGEGDTRASPKIWEDWEGFQAAAEGLKTDAAAAVEANPQDLDAFKAAFGEIAANCGSCHETYRLPED